MGDLRLNATFRPNASPQAKCQNQQLHGPPPNDIRIIPTSIQAMLALIGSMRIQEIGTYRAGLTIWHLQHSAISFSSGRRRNHVQFAASALSLATPFATPLVTPWLPHHLVFPSAMTTLYTSGPRYGTFDFDNCLYGHLQGSLQSHTPEQQHEKQC